MTEAQLFGSLQPQADGSWAFMASAFVQAYASGTVILLDEIDGMDSNVGVALNMALANGKLVTRGGTFTRHPDTIILAAANTYGTGSSAQYVGRNPLDAATLDRFVGAKVEIDYDRDLELALAQSILRASGRFADSDAADLTADRLTLWCWRTREAIGTARLQRILSTRLIVSSARKIGAGYSIEECQADYFVGWSPDERRKVS